MGVVTAVGAAETMADVLRRVGNVAPGRVRMRPVPGTATEEDLIAADVHEDRLFELIDGVLVEKAMGFEESEIATLIIILLGGYVREHNLGIVTAPDGPMRVREGRVRLPDVAFVSWGRLPGRKRPKGAIADLAPDLAVEVLSKSNTKKEMAIKLEDYFGGGTRLVWMIDPRKREARVYTSTTEVVTLGIDGVLEGGEVVPGFRLELRTIFERPEGG